MSSKLLASEDSKDQKNEIKKAVVWDLPVRIFHFTFALGISVAWIIGQTASHRSETFLYHSLFGLIAIFALNIRLAYGLLARNHAKISGFFVSPLKVFDYIKSALTSKSQEFVGHNPASAYVSIAMMLVLIGLISTGVLMGQGNQSAEELHEVLAGAMAILVGIHLAGLVLFTIKSKKNIGLSMIHGKKEVPSEFVSKGNKPILGVVFALLFLMWGIGLFQNLDPQSKSVKLPLTSIELSLKEGKKAKKTKSDDYYKKDHDDDHHD